MTILFIVEVKGTRCCGTATPGAADGNVREVCFIPLEHPEAVNTIGGVSLMQGFSAAGVGYRNNGHRYRDSGPE